MSATDTLTDEQLAKLQRQREATGEAEPDPEEEEDGPAPGEDAEPEPEQEPEPQAAGNVSPKEIDAAMDKLAREAERHAKRVAEIMGADFESLQPCPLDFTPGFVFPNMGQPIEYETVAAVDALLGRDAAPQYRQDETTQTCDRCEGQGFLATGSKRDGFKENACNDCGGQGWKSTTQAPTTQYVPIPLSVPNGGTAEYLPPGAPAKPEPIWDYATQTWKLPGA